MTVLPLCPRGAASKQQRLKVRPRPNDTRSAASPALGRVRKKSVLGFPRLCQGFVRSRIWAPPPWPRLRLLELAIGLPQVVVEDHLQFHSQVVCSVPLLEGHPPKRGLVEVQEKLGRDRGCLSNTAAERMLKHHWGKAKELPRSVQLQVNSSPSPPVQKGGTGPQAQV